MSAARRQAIISKVLTRLYAGHVSSSASDRQSNVKSESVTQLQELRETRSEVGQPPASSSTVHNEEELMPHQKIYTVSLPPDDYVPGPQNDDGSSSIETSDLLEDIEEDQPVKRRKRHRRRKTENVASYTSSENRLNQQPKEHQPLKCEGVFINKNKRRKLQRKRQKERLKAAGLWPKLKTVDLTNLPEQGMVDMDTVEKSIAQSEEEMKKTEDLLNFLQATQEIYFAESKSPCADSALSIELVLEIMNQIKNGAVPFSELCLLHQLKSLLLLQDIERLKDSLDSFKEHSSMCLDHKLALHSLFTYWISDILPIKIKSTS
ncbi:glutamate-rich protein 1 isoform 2-T2 [Mantella aurantiaca]